MSVITEIDGIDIRLILAARVVAAPRMPRLRITLAEAIALAHTIVPPATGDLQFCGLPIDVLP